MARNGQHTGGFQSTLPVGGATLSMLRPADQNNISIHAPRGGSDVFRQILNTG